MKLLFAHDHIFYKNNGQFYTKGTLDCGIWKKYLEFFEQVIVCARVKEVKKIDETFKKSSCPNVDIVEVYSLSGIKGKLKNQKKSSEIISRKIDEVDFIIVRLPSEIGLETFKLIQKKKKAHIIEVVSCIWDGLIYYGGIEAKLYAPIAYIRNKKAIEKAKNVVYVTNEFLQKRYPTLGHSLGCSDVHINECGQAKRRSINRQNCKVGMIANLSNKVKGINIAIEMVKILNEKGINIKLEILGFGESEQWKTFSRKLNVEKNVEFKGGFTQKDKILNWLDEIDIYIQPSYTEGLPRAVIEAMSRGCPVIATNVGGIPELINKHYLIEKGDKVDLANKVEMLIDNRSSYEKSSKENLIISEKFLNSNLEENKRNFYNEIFKNYKRGSYEK